MTVEAAYSAGESAGYEWMVGQGDPSYDAIILAGERHSKASNWTGDEFKAYVTGFCDGAKNARDDR